MIGEKVQQHTVRRNNIRYQNFYVNVIEFKNLKISAAKSSMNTDKIYPHRLFRWSDHH